VFGQTDPPMYALLIGIESKQPIPLRWTAPEVLTARKYSTSSDVYSFGVLIHEIYAPTTMPFCDLDDVSLVKFLLAKARVHTHTDADPTLSAPSSCPALMAQVMEACVQANPLCRPAFQQLLNVLGGGMTADVASLRSDLSALSEETRL
jgi:serine/threonine protein kinase